MTTTTIIIATAICAIFIVAYFIYRRYHYRSNTLTTLSQAAAVIQEYKSRGLLRWNPRDRQLLIEQSLAMIYLSKREWWEAFMKMVLLTATSDRLNEEYEKAVINIEAAAVRKAKAEMKERGITQPLTKADIYRIRQQAREDLTQIDTPTIEEFDIFIIRATATSVHTAKESTGELVAVGHYHLDGKTEMALFDDIKHNLS